MEAEDHREFEGVGLGWPSPAGTDHRIWLSEGVENNDGTLTSTCHGTI